MGQPSYGPAPAPLAGPDLPSFKFAMGAQKLEQFDGGTSKQANVSQFPVSETIAGVYMPLTAGGLRELHWHANAAEWAYMLAGRACITIVDPEGGSQTVDFGRATCGISRAAMVIRSRGWGRTAAPSS